ncbi:hypothetical protein LCGC14_1830490 [marine sediment metagenome]|uniref:Uncharacterized protein n=1 Tax=marine sediment metagenome TaxID=412755 RepID=A0A0F9JFV1_9ZZZZ
MIRLNRLYSTPAVFDEITFTSGVNLILGEPSERNAKTNGVGKSIAIEFLNFGLLSKYSTSRVSKIPDEVFPVDVEVRVDITINGKSLTICRSREGESSPKILMDGVEQVFSKLDDALQFMSALAFPGSSNQHPSFRSMLGIFIRDERSEFKSIISGYDTKIRAADDYGPHLYLLHVDVGLYNRIKDLLSEVKELQSKIKELRKSVEVLRGKSIEEARADLNELDAEVSLIKGDIDGLENSNTYEALETEMQFLEDRISDARRRSAIALEKLSRLEPVEIEKVDIGVDELAEYYNDLKAGLGDFVSRDFGELLSFKTKIHRFQGDVLRRRRSQIESELSRIKKELRTLDKEYNRKLRLLDQEGALKVLRQTFATYQEKSDQLSDLRSFISGHDDAVAERREKILEKDIELQRLQSEIDRAQHVKKSFEATILDIHSEVMRNRQASFTLETVSKANVVDLVLRIDSDGSHSVEREKTFIYDFSLLTNEFTSERHFGFLVHDNIFEVDSDTLKRSLNFIADEAGKLSGQYILTLNSDRALADAADAMRDLSSCVRASFTKENRFLKRKYQEK